MDKAYDVYPAIRSLFDDPRPLFSYYKIPEARRFENTEEYIDNYKKEDL